MKLELLLGLFLAFSLAFLLQQMAGADLHPTGLHHSVKYL